MEYKYQALSSRNEIRILELKPSAFFEDDLHARIVHRQYPIETEDASGVNYWNAASYTWGSESPTEILHIDSTFPNDPNESRTVIKIRPNVDSMLRHLRDKNSEHYLWIDAICLNQEDTAEKNQQVPCMQWIYRLAQQVLIWLGEDDDGTVRLAIKLVHTMAVMSERADLGSGLMTRALGLGARQQLGTERPHALDRLFHRPWFGRRWILQELALAREAIVVCGRQQLPWARFRKGMEVIRDIQSGGLLFHSRLVDDVSAQAIRTLLMVNRTSGLLLDMLWNFDNSACKEKHDVIYALLFMGAGPAPSDKEVGSSIEMDIRSDEDLERLVEMAARLSVSASEGLPVSANYDLPWHQLFTQVAAYFVRTGGFGSITRHLFAFGSLRETNSEWPSWVPDWSRARRAEPRNGMSNVVPWTSPGLVVNDLLSLRGRQLCTAAKVLETLPAQGEVFFESIQELISGSDQTQPIRSGDNVDSSRPLRDLTVSELMVGMLIRKGLDVGLCKPVRAEAEIITEPWIVNDLSAKSIAQTIFVSRNKGLLNGIMACLGGCSLFVTSSKELGIGPAGMQNGDEIFMIDDYGGLPGFNDQTDGTGRLKAAAVLRLDSGPGESRGDQKYILLGPCILPCGEDSSRRINIMLA